MGVDFEKWLFGDQSPGYEGARKQSLKQARRYITSPGTKMGVDTGAGQIGTAGTRWGTAMGGIAQGRQAPTMQAATMGPMSMYGQNLWENRQQNLADMLQRRATGQTPSAAEMQMNRAMQQAVAAQQSAAAGATGANRALASREAARNIAGVTGDIAAQTGTLRAQEQATAEQALSNLLGTGRRQGIDLTQIGTTRDIAGAEFLQGAGRENLQAAINQQSMNDAMTQFYEMQGFSRDVARQQANMDVERLMANNYATSMGVPSQQQQGNLMPLLQMVGQGAVAGATMGGGK
jgi:hypothetical protein